MPKTNSISEKNSISKRSSISKRNSISIRNSISKRNSILESNSMLKSNSISDVRIEFDIEKKLFDFENEFDISSIGKWGGQLKTTKREIRDYMILEL